ncbi:MAG: glycosyltransferase family 9 protein [Phycisphaerales bacterium]
MRPRRYDAALLLTKLSFSTAAGSRPRVHRAKRGYDRDVAVLLTKVRAPRRADGSWAIVPAVTYYHHAASALLDPGTPPLEAPALERADRVDLGLPPGTRMELACTERDEAAAADLFTRARLDPGEPYAVLNPGGNNPAKRWAVERFAAIGDHLASAHGVRVFVAGSPAEADLGRAIAERASCAVAVLPDLGLTLGGLKAVLARARVLVTNDTGPRHIAAAFGTPVVSLFGPTDARWTTIPFEREAVVVADPTLPADQSANDHPDRCSIDRIEVGRVIEGVDGVLAGA